MAVGYTNICSGGGVERIDGIQTTSGYTSSSGYEYIELPENWVMFWAYSLQIVRGAAYEEYTVRLVDESGRSVLIRSEQAQNYSGGALFHFHFTRVKNKLIIREQPMNEVERIRVVELGDGKKHKLQIYRSGTSVRFYASRYPATIATTK